MKGVKKGRKEGSGNKFKMNDDYKNKKEEITLY